ncbi:MAG TPA: hypothetical protein VK928_07860, partial [Longimicrobiales bacterium]|nr:hypothetical protein [Longimicrobiales bacterium]
RAEYLFPTERSANQRVAFSAAELRDGPGIITELLDLAAGGWFIPTTDPDDCRVCDYRAVCRVRDLDYGKLDSPMAAWSREAEGAGPESLRRLRR